MIGRQWRRMGRSQYQMAATVYKRPFLLGISPPKYKDQMFASLGQRLDGGIGKLLPSLTLMRPGLVGTYRQCGIEQQHTLFSPTGQIATRRHRYPQIIMYFFKNILQGRRKGDSVIDRKTQTMRLPRPVIRVLSDNDHLRLVIRTEVESIKNQLSRRITSRRTILLTNEIRQLHEIRLLKFRSQMLFPTRFYLYIHKLFLYTYKNKAFFR